jgi:type III secretion protein L
MRQAPPFNRPMVATLAGVEPGRRIIPADCVAKIERVALDVAAPKQRIEQAEVRCREGLGRVAHAAWQRGFTRGHAEALTKLREFLAGLDERRQRVDSELVGLVADAVGRIVRDLPPALLMESMIESALDEARGEQGRAVLRVHPGQVAIAEAWLKRRPEAPPVGLSLVIEADTALAPDECLLETSSGVIDTSLPIQLEALRATLFASSQPA